MGTYIATPSSDGQVMALGRLQDFTVHVVEGYKVLEYDSLPQREF